MADSPVDRLRAISDALATAAPGISHDEYRAFLHVADHPGASQREVQDALGIPQSSASRHLANLNGSGFGLVDAEACLGKRTNLRLSPKGRQLLAQLSLILGCFVAAHCSLLDDIDCSTPSSPGYDRCADPAIFSCDLS